MVSNLYKYNVRLLDSPHGQPSIKTSLPLVAENATHRSEDTLIYGNVSVNISFSSWTLHLQAFADQI
jgi:hypothetical protein